MKQYLGMTIIELVAILAIISVILLFALPAYKSYVVRVKVAEAMSLTGPVTLAVAETYHTIGAFPSSNTEAGVPSDTDTSYIDKIEVTNQGKVVVTLDAHQLGLSAEQGKTLVFTPRAAAGRVAWDCIGGNLDSKYRPATCRDT